MRSKFIFGLKFVAFALLCVLGIGLLGWAVMALWNCLMPEIFGLTTITYWQALGLFALAKLLFGGFFKGKRHHCGCHGHGHKGGFWKRKWREKLENKFSHMSPEEKEKWKNHFFYRCGGGFEDDDKKSSSDEKQGS